MEQLKLWIQTHKKKVAACMVVILLALGALGLGLAGMQKENQKEVIGKTDQKKKIDKKQTASQPDASASTQKNDAPQTTGGSNGGNSGNGGTQNTAPAHTHNYNIPLYTQQWVVDQAAWTETVNKPVYEMVPVMICNDCGEHLSADNCWDHIENHALNGGKGSWRDTWEQQQTGTETSTILHPEQGHYESVVTGHQCSCGAIQ